MHGKFQAFYSIIHQILKVIYHSKKLIQKSHTTTKPITKAIKA